MPDLCRARDEDYICTLMKGHEGDHKACGSMRTEYYHTWPKIETKEQLEDEDTERG